MRKYGLIGEHLPHSFSGSYFAAKFEREGIEDAEYKLYELPTIEDVKPLLDTLEGFNVTIPYKQQVMKYLTKLSPEAQAIGAVNCVKREGGDLVGYNTDVIGLQASMLEFLGDVRPERALILGTGGASLAVEYVMKSLGIEYTVVSRRAAENRISYDNITPEIIEQHKLIINATPLGTYPNVESAPSINYDCVTSGHYMFDLVYNPPLTKFLELGRGQGAATCNGEAMLHGQAEAAWEIWCRA